MRGRTYLFSESHAVSFFLETALNSLSCSLCHYYHAPHVASPRILESQQKNQCDSASALGTLSSLPHWLFCFPGCGRTPETMGFLSVFPSSRSGIQEAAPRIGLIREIVRKKYTYLNTSPVATLFVLLFVFQDPKIASPSICFSLMCPWILILSADQERVTLFLCFFFSW